MGLSNHCSLRAAMRVDKQSLSMVPSPLSFVNTPHFSVNMMSSFVPFLYLLLYSSHVAGCYSLVSTTSTVKGSNFSDLSVPNPSHILHFNFTYGYSNMVTLPLTPFVALLAYLVGSYGVGYWRNIRRAKASGFTYQVVRKLFLLNPALRH